MEYLFDTTADRWAHKSADRDRWRGLALYGLDGTILRVPDSPENWDAFGGQCGNGTRNGSAYPQVRLVAVMALRSHLEGRLAGGLSSHSVAFHGGARIGSDSQRRPRDHSGSRGGCVVLRRLDGIGAQHYIERNMLRD